MEYRRRQTLPSELEKVDTLLNQMTLDEKIDLPGGVNLFDVLRRARTIVPLLHTANGPLEAHCIEVVIFDEQDPSYRAGGVRHSESWPVCIAGGRSSADQCAEYFSLRRRGTM